MHFRVVHRFTVILIPTTDWNSSYQFTLYILTEVMALKKLSYYLLLSFLHTQLSMNLFPLCYITISVLLPILRIQMALCPCWSLLRLFLKQGPR